MVRMASVYGIFLIVLRCPLASGEIAFEWATIGDPGNAPDQLYTQNNPNNLQFGAVAYAYRISQHEVTNDQYTAFLNAVDPMGTNPNSVYSSFMGSDPHGGIAFNAGAASGSKYSSKTNMGNKPVNNVSFFDAMRFTNWLENGQPTGGSGTENGVYTIDDGLNETRAPGANFFIPKEDEWYKAAYYDLRTSAQGGPPGDDNYWFYPTMSDTAPIVATANAVGDISNPGPNVANYSTGAVWNGEPNMTTVGSAGPLSASFYGTFDQGGNVWEWNEAISNVLFPPRRVLRGGYWNSTRLSSSASFRSSAVPTDTFANFGFRVASIPEAETPGDFDGDDDVDGFDVLAWQRNPSLGSLADWESNYGLAPDTNTVAVPEPSALALALAVIQLACFRRSSSQTCGPLFPNSLSRE